MPIEFRLEYPREEISPNRYGVYARIKYSDGRMAFTHDTAYEVITLWQPTEVDLVLSMANGSPELFNEKKITGVPDRMEPGI